MYANLEVRTKHETLFAHEVRIEADEIVVCLDDPEDNSDYAAPYGELRFARTADLTITITASF